MLKMSNESDNRIQPEVVGAAAKNIDRNNYKGLESSHIPQSGEEHRRILIEVEREFVILQGLYDHYSHKKYWSYFLMSLITALLTCEYLILYGVGINYLDFLDYQWLLPTLLLQTLLQIFALAVIVVKSLFSEKSG